MPLPFSLGEFCQVLVFNVHKTSISLFWEIVHWTWPWYGLAIVLMMSIWVFIEIKTRYGTFHYNSVNGFSPLFNSVVGGGVYASLQALAYLILSLLFGGSIYCMPVPYVAHLFIFIFTARILNVVGFWPEVRISRRRKWKNIKGVKDQFH